MKKIILDTTNPISLTVTNDTYNYFFKNEDGYTIGLSPEELSATLGVKKTAYQTAFNLLVATGYLKLREGSKVHYDFIPYPS